MRCHQPMTSLETAWPCGSLPHTLRNPSATQYHLLIVNVPSLLQSDPRILTFCLTRDALVSCPRPQPFYLPAPHPARSDQSLVFIFLQKFSLFLIKSIYQMCRVLVQVKRGCQMPWDQSYSLVSHHVVLKLEPRSSGSAASALNC